MARKPLNYTTAIPARRTASECSELLAEAGAARVAVEYASKNPVGLSFRLEMPSGWQDFAMPVNIDGIHELLKQANAKGQLRSDGHRNSSYETTGHALNVGWRVIKDWLEAQLALIAAEMVSLDQVMLPYLQLEQGTLYEVIRDQHLALPAGPHA